MTQLSNNIENILKPITKNISNNDLENLRYELIKYENAYEVLGWAHAEMCSMLDAEVDPRTVDISVIVKRMEEAFNKKGN
jgi:hypothetical protein